MSDIELVIKISKEDYKAIKNMQAIGDLTIPYVFDAIRNGTSLPKGHGDLIERERLQEVFRRNVVGYAGFKQLFDIAPIIVEADRSDEE